MEVEGIILAAGLSTRAKEFKMTLAFNGKTIIENTIDNMLETCSKIYVIGGYQIEVLQPIVQRYSRVILVNNQDYLTGMYSSVKKGMSCITTERFFFTPGDYPLILPEVYQSMLRVAAPVVIPTYKGRKGHPVLFDQAIARSVLLDQKSCSLRDVIQQHEKALVEVDCRGILMDLDTIEDYKLLLNQLDKGVRV